MLLMLKQELFMMLGKSCPPTILEEELAAGLTGLSQILLNPILLLGEGYNPCASSGGEPFTGNIKSQVGEQSSFSLSSRGGSQLAGRLSARPQSPGLPRCSDRRSDTVLAEPRSLLPLSEERRGSLHPECLSRVLDFELSSGKNMNSETQYLDSHAEQSGEIRSRATNFSVYKGSDSCWTSGLQKEDPDTLLGKPWCPDSKRNEMCA
ncbi:hypothetical protein E5288_WYG010744 [Bos mutus]|uniref:Uncharacterized protein n=1 Tax=Bos mutus TaxID=72004 RepID=A0A6B0RY94_9CETA|nr:hypothetical protein [Bos mutus]